MSNKNLIDILWFAYTLTVEEFSTDTTTTTHFEKGCAEEFHVAIAINKIRLGEKGKYNSVPCVERRHTRSSNLLFAI